VFGRDQRRRDQRLAAGLGSWFPRSENPDLGHPESAAERPSPDPGHPPAKARDRDARSRFVSPGLKPLRVRVRAFRGLKAPAPSEGL
jgi:hypothetical protein